MVASETISLTARIIFYEDFLATEPYPSYFALETQVMPGGGQVLRFNSSSKCLSAGMRLGFAVGPAPIIRPINMNTSAANLQTNSMAQAMTLRLLRFCE
jgi:tryptophan aminotransferase